VPILSVYLWLASDLQEQYQGLCGLVQTHAVVAIGLCLAVRVPRTGDSAVPAYRLHTFSIPVFQSVRGDGRGTLVLWQYRIRLTRRSVHHSSSQTEFVVSPASLVFLVEHGFDFNYMITAGVPFRPAGLAAATDTVRAYHSSNWTVFDFILTRDTALLMPQATASLVVQGRPGAADRHGRPVRCPAGVARHAAEGQVPAGGAQRPAGPALPVPRPRGPPAVYLGGCTRHIRKHAPDRAD